MTGPSKNLCALRRALAALVALASFCSPPLACSAQSAVQLFARELTGELEFVNTSTGTVSLAGYTIESNLGSLIFGEWTPVSGRLDAQGSGAFDSMADWIVLSTAGSDDDFSEGAALGPGGALAPGANLSLGQAWDPTVAWDLTASVILDDVPLIAEVLYIRIGDYNSDGAVDSADFSVYQSTYGSSIDLRADGNNDGVVDAIDYAIWREARSAITPWAAQPALAAIPEPAALVLVMAALAALALMTMRPAPLHSQVEVARLRPDASRRRVDRK